MSLPTVVCVINYSVATFVFPQRTRQKKTFDVIGNGNYRFLSDYFGSDGIGMFHQSWIGLDSDLKLTNCRIAIQSDPMHTSRRDCYCWGKS